MAAELRGDGIQVVRIWTFLAANEGRVRRSLNYLSYLLFATWAALFRRAPDVLIATSPQMFCGVAGGLVSLCKGCPFVLEVRDLWPESIAAVGAAQKSVLLRLLERLERWMYRKADLIVAVGKGYKKKLIERGVPEGKIEIVTNSVDLGLFTPRAPDPALRKRLGLDGKLSVAYVGTVGMAAGLDVVLEASRILQGRRWAVRFVIAGDGASRARLEGEAQNSRTTGNGVPDVLFTGLLPKAEIPSLLAAVDVCLVHLREAQLFLTVLPSKIFEAAAMQKPILIGVQGDAEELVREAGAGLAFAAGNAWQLADAAERLAGSPPLREELGKNAQERIARRFDADAIAREYLGILERLVRATRPA